MCDASPRPTRSSTSIQAKISLGSYHALPPAPRNDRSAAFCDIRAAIVAADLDPVLFMGIAVALIQANGDVKLAAKSAKRSERTITRRRRQLCEIGINLGKESPVIRDRKHSKEFLSLRFRSYNKHPTTSVASNNACGKPLPTMVEGDFEFGIGFSMLAAYNGVDLSPMQCRHLLKSAIKLRPTTDPEELFHWLARRCKKSWKRMDCPFAYINGIIARNWRKPYEHEYQSAPICQPRTEPKKPSPPCTEKKPESKKTPENTSNNPVKSANSLATQKPSTTNTSSPPPPPISPIPIWPFLKTSTTTFTRISPPCATSSVPPDASSSSRTPTASNPSKNSQPTRNSVDETLPRTIDNHLLKIWPNIQRLKISNTPSCRRLSHAEAVAECKRQLAALRERDP